jgi:predicted nucleotidyltransferase
MRIQKDQMIGDLPALSARRFMQRHRDTVFAAESLKDHFPEMPDDALHRTWSVFLETGYIEFREERNGRSWYEMTTKGNALAQASAAQPISRKTAKKKLHEFMRRVEEINQNEEYAFTVVRVALFGSMLSDSPEVSDIDLAIELKARFSDKQAFRDHQQRRVELALSNGKSFRTFVERALWPRHEILFFLKARSRVFSIHETEDLANLKSDEFKMLLGDPPMFSAL